MNEVSLFEFQRKCVNDLIDNILNGENKEILLQAPTGAGKTIILEALISEYNDLIGDSVFIWLTPGTGELEEQSMKKMNLYFPAENTKDLKDVLSDGFESRDTAFINWEAVNKKGNTALKEYERKNILDCIDFAHNKNLKFIVIIDEEHLNQTIKSEAIIQYFNPYRIIRVSATTKIRKNATFLQIKETDVISSGLITKSIYINDLVDNKTVYEDETEYLINIGLKKRNLIRQEYLKNDIQVNPLMIIQFPNKSDDLISKVEKHLKNNNISYDNGRLSIKMDKREKNFENISDNESQQTVLLMKQAIATGWDCPRAKILIKLRENMSEDFETQVIGRIRRMPQRCHYNNELLDNCYLYTFDEKYESTIKQELGKNAKDVKLLRLKPEFKNFSLIKELKSDENTIVGEREIFNIIFNYFKDKYSLSNDIESNKIRLSSNGFTFDTAVYTNVITDKITTIDNDELDYARRTTIKTEIDPKKNIADLRKIIATNATLIGIDYDKMKTVLERMLLKRKLFKNRFFNMNLKEFYAFVINNSKKINDDIIEAVTQKTIQLEFDFDKIIFRFPEIGILKYDKDDIDMPYYRKNVYNKYFLSRFKSNSETLFEEYCDNSNFIKWFYKNGESSTEYFSIVYNNKVGKQWLFYPDYILEDKNNNIWIIETKGGEDREGNSKNIDKQIENKFEALKRYSNEHNIKWGFVRDNEKNKKLYFNNTIYTEEMENNNWQLLDNIFKEM